MINTAQFRIIGRIGTINKLEKVTHLSIASDRRAKDDKGNWSTHTNWITVTLLSAQLRKRLEDPKVSRHGNLVAFDGSIQSNTFIKDGERVYSTSLIAQSFEVLSFAKSNN